MNEKWYVKFQPTCLLPAKQITVVSELAGLATYFFKRSKRGGGRISGGGVGGYFGKYWNQTANIGQILLQTRGKRTILVRAPKTS